MLFQRIEKHGITMVFHMYHNHTMVLHSITIVHVRKHGNTMIMNDYYINKPLYFVVFQGIEKNTIVHAQKL